MFSLSFQLYGKTPNFLFTGIDIGKDRNHVPDEEKVLLFINYKISRTQAVCHFDELYKQT